MSDHAPWNLILPWPRDGKGDEVIRVSADDPTRRLIARHLGLERIGALCATLEIRTWLDGVEIKGRLQGEVTRLCDLSLDPFDVQIDDEVGLRALHLGSPHLPVMADSELVIDLEVDDPPEAFGPEGIDLGSFLVEALALSLDPFPRKPGAIFETSAPAAESSPFAILAPRRGPQRPEG